MDLKGYSSIEAVAKCREMLAVVVKALNTGLVKPNRNNGVDHIYKIVAHAGKHSEGGIGKLKIVVQEMLIQDGYDFFA